MNFLFECAPIESTTGVPVTYRFASLNGLSNSTLIDGKEWDAAIVETPVTSTVFYQSGLVQQTSVDYGSITIQLTSATANLATMQWDGATGRVWVGVAGQPFTSYRKLFEGKLGAHSKTSDALKIPLYGLDFKLNETEILTSTYAGTGGAEGSAGIKGNYKPRAYGVCRYVTPVLINEAYQVYQVHDGACADITNVFEYAISNPKLVGNVVTTYAQLIALDLQPGTWAKAPAIGMFRMGSVPSGKFTADVIGDVAAGLNLASISRAILIGAGMASSDIDASLESVAGSIAWNAYITDQAMVGETLRTAFASAFLYANSNEAGKFQVGSWLANGATLNVGGPNATLNIIPGSLSLEEAAPANYSVTINAEKCWTVHSADDISPAILDLQEGQEALIAVAQAAKATADQAAADIIVEKARTDAILNDGILDRNEKAERKLAYAGITTDYAKNISQATGFGISTTAYANAYAALATYLNGLSPAWNDITQETPITRSTWDTAWEGERSQRFAILRAIADATSKLANWGGVSGPGKPEDGATVGGIIGSNIKNPDGSVYVPPTADQLVDSTPPGVVTNLALTSAITDAGVDLNITWTGPSDSDLAGYDLAIKQGSGGYIVFVTTDAAYKFAAQPRNTDFTAKVRAFDKAGNRGVYTAEKTIRTARDTVAPAPVTAVTVDPAFQTAFVNFTAPADLDTDTVSVNLNDAAGTLVKTVRVSVSPGGRGQVSFSNLNKATSYSVTTFATDDSGNNSTSTAPTPFLTAGGVNLADFTPGLSGNETVAALPTSGNFVGRVVFLQSDNKLYRYTSTGWSSAVATADLVGQIEDNNIAALTSSKIVGKLTNDQLSAISSDKITGQISETQISNNSITTGKIRANAVTATEIATGAITARTLAIGNFDNIIPDGDFRDPAWWNSNNPDSRLSVEAVTFTKFPRALVIRPAGGIDILSSLFAVEPGATYKISMGLDVGADFVGTFRPVIHMPGLQWFSVKTGTGFDPANTDPAFSYTAAGTSINLDQIYSIPLGSADNNRWQFRLMGGWTGTVRVAFRIIRVSDSTLIADGAVTTDKIIVNSLAGNRIQTNTLNADRITSNTIATNKLVVMSRPVSTTGINLRVDIDNVVRWDAGFITFPDNDGNFVTREISAGGYSWQGWTAPVNFCYNVSTDNKQLQLYYTADVAAYAVLLPLATWNNGTDLVVKSGTSTLVNGDRIVTGSVNANKIVARSITADQLGVGAVTANSILAGTITAAQLAAGAVSATKLLVTSMTNLNADPGFRDTKYWRNEGAGANGDLGTNAGSSAGWYNSHGSDINSLIGTTQYAMLWEAYFKSAGRQHLFSQTNKNIKAGSTYSLSAFCRNASSDTILVYIRFFNVNAEYMSDIALVWNAGEHSTKSTQFVAPAGVNSYQFIVFNLTNGSQFSGNAQVANLQVVEAVDATTIMDGAITTNKITVGTLNGDRIAVGTMSADKIAANTVMSNTITVAGTSGNIGDAVINATTAASAIVAMTSDNILSKSEKSELISRYQIMEQQWVYTRDTASGLGIPYAALDNSHAALAAYLTSISPHWADTNSDSPMDGAYLRVLFVNYSASMADLVRSINQTAAGRATWAGVSGANRPADNATVGAPAGTLVGNTEAQTVTNWAFNPAPQINAQTTQIDPGKINISGGTTLASWRGGGDNTQINGGAIAANTIKANSVTIGNRNISVIGCDFRYEGGALRWSDGYVLWTDDNGNPAASGIAAGGVAWNGGSFNYIVWDKGAVSLRQTNPDEWQPSQNNAANSVIMCTWRNGSNFVANYGGTIISGDRIVTNSITATQIATGAITADKMTIGNPTGARLALANNLISGYFANGNIAFQIGVF